jgi:outer membrane protein OmpA-like peptidoglycan-associated protein
MHNQGSDMHQSLDITFRIRTAELTDQAKQLLRSVVRALENDPARSLEFGGLTIGADRNGLSMRRVEAVRQFLLAQGVAQSRIRILRSRPRIDFGRS